MRVRDIKRRVTRLMEPQIVRKGMWANYQWVSAVRSARFFGCIYPVRQHKRKALFTGELGTVHGVSLIVARCILADTDSNLTQPLVIGIDPGTDDRTGYAVMEGGNVVQAGSIVNKEQ